MGINIQYTNQILASAMRRYIVYQWRFYIIFMLIFYLIIVFSALAFPGTGKFLSFKIISFPLFIPLVGYFKSLSRTKAVFKDVPNQQMQFDFSANGVETKTNLRESNSKWQSFYQLLQFNDFWLLFPSKRVFFILPVNKLDENTKALIVNQLKNNNVKVLPLLQGYYNF